MDRLNEVRTMEKLSAEIYRYFGVLIDDHVNNWDIKSHGPLMFVSITSCIYRLYLV